MKRVRASARSWAGGALFGTGAVVLAACAQIIGIDDRSGSPASGADEGATGASAGASTGSGESGSFASGSASSGVVSPGSGSVASGAGTSGGIESGAAASGASTSGMASSGLSSSGAASGTMSSGASASGSGSGSGSQNDAQVNDCPDPCVMATGLNHPYFMVTDANNVYWTEYGDDTGAGNGYVMSCPLTGCGSKPTVIAQAQINPVGIAVDAKNVYWTTSTYGSVSGGVWSCPIAGCVTPTNLVSALDPYGLALSGTFLYWVDYDDGTTHQIDLGSKVDKTLYNPSKSPNGAQIFGTEDVTVDTQYIYETDYNQDLYRIPIAGGNPIQFNSGDLGGYAPVLVNQGTIYFGAGNFILQVPSQNNPPKPTNVTAVTDPDGLVFDASSNTLYWSNWGTGNANDGTIGKISLTTHVPVTMASSLQTPEAIALAGNNVYWLTYGKEDFATGNTAASTGTLTRSAK